MLMDNTLKDKDSGSVLILPPYTPSQPPPSGYRIVLSASSSFCSKFPSVMYTKQPPFHDDDAAHSPIFIGSAMFNNGVHPCKIASAHISPCLVPYGSSEVPHRGRYYLLPFDKETMEWVPTGFGRIPTNRRPVQGGYEENGAKLYHAAANVGLLNTRVPGKTGEHLRGCHVPYGGVAHFITGEYDILCWK